MDTARYVFAVAIVTMLPPGLLWWFAVHPFVAFWRRLGPRLTLTVVGTASIVGAALLWTVRASLVGRDLGTSPVALVGAAILLSCGVAIALQRRKHLTSRVLAGVPELESDGRRGELLQSGIYARIRHPRYVEVAVGTLAYALFANHVGSWVVAIATIPTLHLIVLVEERELMQRFGAEYEEYRLRVPRYVPRRRPRT